MKQASILLLVILIGSCSNKKRQIIKTGLEGETMPAIELIAPDSVSRIYTQNIALGKPTILFAFEPWCPYCKAQTRSMLAQIKKLQNINIYMLCTSPYSQFKSFYKKYELEKYPNIKAGVDYKTSFAKYFHPLGIPYLAIYSDQKKLKEVLAGKNFIGTIKEAALK
jgi:thiol-disulfide isomerase/thioredoxin